MIIEESEFNQNKAYSQKEWALFFCLTTFADTNHACLPVGRDRFLMGMGFCFSPLAIHALR